MVAVLGRVPVRQRRAVTMRRIDEEDEREVRHEMK